MKSISALALLVTAALQFPSSAYLSLYPSSASAVKTAPSSHLRVGCPTSVVLLSVEHEESRHRSLQPRPDETCYTTSVPESNTDPERVACTPSLLAHCSYNVTRCTPSQIDAANNGWLFCSTWAVWTTAVLECPWQYACCDP
jgi:hypothetical protein